MFNIFTQQNSLKCKHLNNGTPPFCNRADLHNRVALHHIYFTEHLYITDQFKKTEIYNTQRLNHLYTTDRFYKTAYTLHYNTLTQQKSLTCIHLNNFPPLLCNRVALHHVYFAEYLYTTDQFYKLKQIYNTFKQKYSLICIHLNNCIV